MRPFTELDRAMLGDIYTSVEPIDNLIVLCDDCGARSAGSSQERDAAQFLHDRLAHYGFRNTRLEPYDYAAWERGESYLRVVEPFEAEIPCIALPYCPPCDVSATLVLLEDGGPTSFQSNAGEIDGEIVGVSSAPPKDLERTVHRTEMYHRSATAGAIGFIFIGMYEGRGPETGSLDNDREALIPGISIDHEAAEYLRRQTRRKGSLRINIRTTGRTYPSTSWNVIGELPGRTDELVVVGSHYDGHDIAQGATDPASGVVAALEAARVLGLHASGKLHRTVRAMFWGTEEIGLIGAYRDVEAHPEDLDRIRFLLNCDAAGSSGEKGVILNQWPELEPLFVQWGEQMGDLPFKQSTHAFSDHYPYFLAGVPTSYIGNPRGRFTGRGWGHTRYDTVDKVELADVRNASALAARVVLRAASTVDWPAKRRSVDAVAPLMDDEPSLREMREAHDAYAALYERRGKSRFTSEG